MVTKVQRWGNSLGLRIPRAFAAEARLASGSAVNIAVRAGELIVTPLEPGRYRLEDLLAKVTAANLHGEIRTGRAVGREVW